MMLLKKYIGKNCELISELRTDFGIIRIIVNKKKNNFKNNSQIKKSIQSRPFIKFKNELCALEVRTTFGIIQVEFVLVNFLFTLFQDKNYKKAKQLLVTHSAIVTGNFLKSGEPPLGIFVRKFFSSIS